MPAELLEPLSELELHPDNSKIKVKKMTKFLLMILLSQRPLTYWGAEQVVLPQYSYTVKDH
jgi:hypothetical protein